MPFIPHTPEEVQAMLAAIGVDQIEDLFAEIPASLRYQGGFNKLGAPVWEAEISRIMQDKAKQDGQPLCFIGAGAYDHYIPAAIWPLVSRGELYTAYTPYQAEASQGSLQILYEYQSMMAALMAMDVANASLYDGASALAEMVLMAVRAHRRSKSKTILMPRSVHPHYRQVVRTLVQPQGIQIIEIEYDRRSGQMDWQDLERYAGQDITALVIPQPNFFGVLEEVHQLCDWIHQHNGLAIALVNPIAMSWLSPPGEWGREGADMACGEGQPLGIPLSSGGPYLGFACCRQTWVRQMPGRIAGRTVDAEGKPGYTLTLQAREQHIRRSKATSNICSNQGLMVVAATLYMALLGGEGLQAVAQQSHQQLRSLVAKLEELGEIEPIFTAPHFHECALRLPLEAKRVIKTLSAHNLLPGYDLSQHYPELGHALLVCATEARNEKDLHQYQFKMRQVLASRRQGACATRVKI